MVLTADQIQQMDMDSGLSASKVAQMDIDAGLSSDIPEPDDSWMRHVVTPKQIDEWKKTGPIGAMEAFNRFDKWKMVPYAGGFYEAAKDIPIALKLQRAANGEQMTAQDKQEISSFIKDYAEIQARGYSFGGNMVNGGLEGIPFLVEAGIAIGTGGLAGAGSAAKMAAGKGAKAAVGKAVEGVIGKALGKEVLEQASKMSSSAIARNAAISIGSRLPSYARGFGQTYLNEGLAVTDKGEIYARQAQMTPATMALRVMGETEIELASEMSGGLLFRPVVKFGSSMMPKTLVSALDDLALTKGGKAVSTMLRARDKVGFNGFLEEMGEEVVGNVLKTTFDLDQEQGYSFDQFLDALTFNRGNDLAITAGLIAIQGGLSVGTVKAVNAMQKAGATPEDIENFIANSTETERETLAEKFGEAATAQDATDDVAEAPPGVEQTGDFTAIDTYTDEPSLVGSVSMDVEKTPQQRMDEVLAGGVSSESGKTVTWKGTDAQSAELADYAVVAGQDKINMSVVDKARGKQLRADIKVVDKELNGLSKEHAKFEKVWQETNDLKEREKAQRRMDELDAKMEPLIKKRDELETQRQTVGSAADRIAMNNPLYNEREKATVQMSTRQAIELQKTDKSQRVLAAIKKGFDSGVAMTRASLKIAQNEYKNLVRLLPTSERGKVAFDFQKFNSVEEAKKNYPEFEAKVQNILALVANTDMHGKIAKELSTKATTKQGSTVKAKFDAESTAVFKELQNIMSLRDLALKSTEHEKLSDENKAKRAEAQNTLRTMLFNARIAEKTGTFEERLTNRMIAYANTRPENVSVDEMEALLSDVQRLKEEGRDARNEEELQKKLNRQTVVTDVVDALNKYQKSNAVLEKMKSFFVANNANVYSLFNAYMGKAFADKYDTSLAQSKLSNAVYFSSRKLTDKIVNAMKVKRAEELPRLVSEMSEVNSDWVLVKQDSKVARQLSVFDVMDIYNSIKNEDIAADYERYYGKDQVDALVGRLTPEQMEMADALAEHVRSYEKTLNDYSLRKFGLPLARRANYWPATSEHHGDEYDALKTYIPDTKIPSALKQKVKSSVPIPRNAWQKTQKHLYQAEYVANLADTYETVDSMLKDYDVENAIKNTIGENVLQQLKTELYHMSLQKGIEVNSEYGNAIEQLLGRWTSVMVASPRVFLRQLAAVTTYSAEENMPLATWSKYFAEALKNPKETIDYMRRELPYLEARFNEGYDEAIAKALREAKHTSEFEQDWVKAVTFFTKTGDIGSIMFGGYPYYKHMLESGMSKEEATNKFVFTTERITQGKESSNLSMLQKDNRFNMFTRFLNSPNQFVRQIVDAQIQYSRKEISGATYAKKMSQYLVMQPLLYSVIGSTYKAAAESIYGAFGGDTDDAEKRLAETFFDMVNQIVLTPFNVVPFVNEGVEYLLRSVEGQPTYGLFEAQLASDLAKESIGVVTSVKHENLAGVLYHFALLSQPFVRVPVKQITDAIDTVVGGELKEAVSNKKKKRKAVY